MGFMSDFARGFGSAAAQAQHQKLQQTMNDSTREYRASQTQANGLTPGQTDQYVKFEQALVRFQDKLAEATTTINALFIIMITEKSEMDDEGLLDTRKSILAMLDEAANELELFYNAGKFFDTLSHMKTIHTDAMRAIHSQRSMLRMIFERPKLVGDDRVMPTPEPVAAPGTSPTVVIQDGKVLTGDPEKSWNWHLSMLKDLEKQMDEKIAWMVAHNKPDLYLDSLRSRANDIVNHIREGRGILASATIANDAAGGKWSANMKKWYAYFDDIEPMVDEYRQTFL